MDHVEAPLYQFPPRAKLCGCTALSTATKAIGLLFLVTSIVIGEYTVTYIRKHPGISMVFVYMGACFVILHAFMAVLLLVAASKENAPLLLVWIIFELIFTALQGLTVFDLIFVHLEFFSAADSIFNFLLVGIQLYAILVVDQFHRQVRWQYIHPGPHTHVDARPV